MTEKTDIDLLLNWFGPEAKIGEKYPFHGLPMAVSVKDFQRLITKLAKLDEKAWPDLLVSYIKKNDGTFVIIGIGPRRWAANQCTQCLSAESLLKHPEMYLESEGDKIHLKNLRVPEDFSRFPNLSLGGLRLEKH